MNKSLTKNSLYNILYKLISVLYPLVAVTYVSHILMSQRMGMVSYAQNIVSYFAVIAALGIPTYGIREIAVRGKDFNDRNKTFWELFIINAISTTVSLVAFCILINSIEKFKSQILLYLVAGFQIFLNYLNVDWFYQGIEEYKYISIRSIIVKIVALVLLPILIRKPQDYINYAFIYCLAIAGNNIFNVVRLRKYISKPTRNLEIKKHLRSIIILLLVSIAVEVYAMVDTTMLGIFSTDSVVGCYSNAMKLTRMVTTMASAIGAVLFPRLSTIYQDKEKDKFNELVNKGIKIMLIIAVPGALGLILLSKEIIIIFFGQSFINAVPILKILALMIPVVVCNTLMGGQVLVTTGQESKYMISVVTASVVNVILNSLFIPKFGAPSAAFASLISETLVLVMYIFFAKDQVRLRFSHRYIFSMVLPLLVYMLVHYFLLENMIVNDVVSIILNVVICISIYFGFGVVLKNEAMIFVFDKIKYMIKQVVRDGVN